MHHGPKKQCTPHFLQPSSPPPATYWRVGSDSTFLQLSGLQIHPLNAERYNNSVDLTALLEVGQVP